MSLLAAGIAAAAFASPLSPRAVSAQDPAQAGDLSQHGVIRTVVLDPGHGGADEGVHGLNGTKEKDLVLAFARRLKAEIESKLQIHVLLTREGDDSVPIDSRAVYANTSKADLFISLHANASVRQTLRGTEVMYLSTEDIAPTLSGGKTTRPAVTKPPETVPLVNGGTRLIQPVPWDVAQLPYVEQSAIFSATLVKHLTDRAIPGNMPLQATAPLRALVGANMPAVLVELGFLTNPDDEAALNGPDAPAAIIAAIVDTIADVKFGFPAPGGGATRTGGGTAQK